MAAGPADWAEAALDTPTDSNQRTFFAVPGLRRAITPLLFVHRRSSQPGRPLLGQGDVLQVKLAVVR